MTIEASLNGDRFQRSRGAGYGRFATGRRSFRRKGQVPPLGRQGEQRVGSLQLQVVLDAFCPGAASPWCSRGRWAIPRLPPGGRRTFPSERPGSGRPAGLPSVPESDEVVGRGPVAVDGVNGGSQHVLVVVEPSGPEVGDRNLLDAEIGRRAGLELGVDLRSEGFRGLAIRAVAAGRLRGNRVTSPCFGGTPEPCRRESKQGTTEAWRLRQRRFPPQTASQK